MTQSSRRVGRLPPWPAAVGANRLGRRPLVPMPSTARRCRRQSVSIGDSQSGMAAGVAAQVPRRRGGSTTHTGAGGGRRSHGEGGRAEVLEESARGPRFHDGWRGCAAAARAERASCFRTRGAPLSDRQMDNYRSPRVPATSLPTESIQEASYFNYLTEVYCHFPRVSRAPNFSSSTLLWYFPLKRTPRRSYAR